MTETGLIMGTAPYMSSRAGSSGQEVDQAAPMSGPSGSFSGRCWSGKRLFDAESSDHRDRWPTVLRAEVDLGQPARFRHQPAIRRLLQPLPPTRAQAAGFTTVADARLEIQEAANGGRRGAAPGDSGFRPPSSTRVWPRAAGGSCRPAGPRADRGIASDPDAAWLGRSSRPVFRSLVSPFRTTGGELHSRESACTVPDGSFHLMANRVLPTKRCEAAGQPCLVDPQFRPRVSFMSISRGRRRAMSTLSGHPTEPVDRLLRRSENKLRRIASTSTAAATSMFYAEAPRRQGAGLGAPMEGVIVFGRARSPEKSASMAVSEDV